MEAMVVFLCIFVKIYRTREEITLKLEFLWVKIFIQNENIDPDSSKFLDRNNMLNSVKNKESIIVW